MYKLVSAPAAEPVTLAEAKEHLRVDASYTDTDTLITGQIIGARQYAENHLRRALMTQTWKYIADSFTGAGLIGIQTGRTFSLPGHALILEKSPVISVESITYLDFSGVRQIMPATDYALDLVSEPCRITPVFGKIWPIALPQIGAVEINFTAGYGAAAAVPELIKIAIKLLIEAAYDASFNDKGNLEHERKIKAAENLMNTYRVLI